MTDDELEKGSDDNYKRKSRAKSHERWDRTIEKSNGRYTEVMHIISTKLPELTLTELKICVLVWDLKSGNEIAEIFETTPQTIYNHRSEIRAKIGLKSRRQLHSFLNSLLNASD